jgi:hypothetical protein
VTSVSPRVLKILAALVWYLGGFILLLKGGSLLLEAAELRPGQPWPWLVVGLALVLGWLKIRFIFVKSCRKNLARIDTLDEPRIWQFYRPGFYVALAAMIAAGATLSRLAHGDYVFLLAVATLDLALSTALLGSSYVYWQGRAFSSRPQKQISEE